MQRIINKNTKLFLRDDFVTDSNTEIALEVNPAQGLYRPKWNGTKWIEAMSQEEIDAMQGQTATPEPSIDERVEKLEEAVSNLIQ